MSRKSLFSAAAAIVAVGLLAGCEESSEEVASTDAAPQAETHSHEDTPAVSVGGMPELFDDDRILGDPNAPVTIVEYSSLTCPHCASFHRDTLPQLKKEYIDTGKAKLVYRDFPFDRLGATAAMLARCGGAERVHGYLDVLFMQQGKWATAQDPIAALSRIARLGGMSEAAFQSCMANEPLAEMVVASRVKGSEEFDITSTPSFVIGGKTYSGGLGVEEFDKILAPYLGEE